MDLISEKNKYLPNTLFIKKLIPTFGHSFVQTKMISYESQRISR